MRVPWTRPSRVPGRGALMFAATVAPGDSRLVLVYVTRIVCGLQSRISRVPILPVLSPAPRVFRLAPVSTLFVLGWHPARRHPVPYYYGRELYTKV